MSFRNAENCLERSISSVLNQTYKNLEIFLTDDSSQDNTLKLLREFAKFDKRIILINNKKHEGLTKSLNIMLKKSTGDIIARQDADDVSDLSRLSKQIEYLFTNNLDACFTRAISIQNKKLLHKTSHYLPKKLIVKYKNPFIHGTLMMKKKIFQALNFYNERFFFSQDYKLMYDFLSKNYKVKILNEPLYYLNTVDNISSNYRSEQKYFADCVRKNIEPNKFLIS